MRPTVLDFKVSSHEQRNKDVYLTTTAANITLTLQTLKMVLAGLEESSVEQRCAIAGHLLDALASIPTPYIAAISATMAGAQCFHRRRR